MFGEIVRIIVPLIPRLIPIAKRVKPSVQVVETGTHVIFYLTKKNSESTDIYEILQRVAPEASLILYTPDGTPFLNISAEEEKVEKVLEEATQHGEKQQKEV